MATNESKSAASDTQLTNTPPKSDQPNSPSARKQTDSHTPTHNPASEKAERQEEPLTLTPTETQPKSKTKSPQAQKETKATTDVPAGSHVSQEAEVVPEDEEQSPPDPTLPRIDAVWSIGQEHSYEQRPGKRNNWSATNDTAQVFSQTDENQEPGNIYSSSGFGQQTRTHSIASQHTPRLFCSETPGLGLPHIHSNHMVKIKTKASRKYFVQDDPGGGQKHLSFHEARNQPATKQVYKSLQVSEPPFAGSNALHQMNHCLIDHNLKPLQIQHNLENKRGKSKGPLLLDKLGLKYGHDLKEDAYYLNPPSKKSSRIDNHEKFILKEVQHHKLNYTADHFSKEVGSEAVYLDVDADPSVDLLFNGTRQLVHMESVDADENIHGALNNSSLHNLSMDQYLPDFHDLPQFPNIPMDVEEDKCSEPLQLTPSISHDVISYDWQQHAASWYGGYASSTPAAAITIPTHLPHVATETVSNPASLCEFRSEGDCQGKVKDKDSADVKENGAVPAVSYSARLVCTEGSTTPTASSSMNHLDVAAASVTSAASSSVATTTVIKSTEQVQWHRSENNTQAPAATVTTKSTAAVCQPLTSTHHTTTAMTRPVTSSDQQFSATDPPSDVSSQPLSTTSQASSQDGSISGALMTAFELDSHHSNLIDLQTSTHFPHDCHPTYPYTDDGVAIGMGCSSTFLSPPPSVEQRASQSSTPCPDNESGYITMEEQDVHSPCNLYWQQQYQGGAMLEEGDAAYSKMYPHHMYPGSLPFGGGYGAVGGYPYTHHDSHYQTLHQTATSIASTTTASAPANNSNDIIYYPFNDLMQLHPSLLGNDQDASIQYVHPEPYPQSHPNQTMTQAYPHPPQPNPSQPTLVKKRGRGGRPRGSGRSSVPSQVQSNQITSSLQRQLQGQTALTPKRQYRRRNPNPNPKKKPAPTPKTPRSTNASSGSADDDKKNRHNEPLNQRAVAIMLEWYQEHEDNPYPSKDEKEQMAKAGGITTMQVKSWFANKRNRSNNTRPKVQKRAMEEKLMQIYNQLSKTEGASVQEGGGNSLIIKELSQIIHKRFEPEMPGTPESATST